MDRKYVVNKNSHTKIIKVPEATEILAQYGIVYDAKDERKTRDLISKGRLDAAKDKEANPRDRRAPYFTSQSALYKLIIDEIPIMKEIFEELYSNEKTNAKTANSKANTKGKSSNGQAPVSENAQK